MKYTVKIQVRVDDNFKKARDDLFSSFGLDTSTGVRKFWWQRLKLAGFLLRSSVEPTVALIVMPPFVKTTEYIR